jgi:PAS domain S-box-containing protein
VVDKKSYRFLAVNKAAPERYGYTEAEMLRLRVMDLWPKAKSAGYRKKLKSRAEGSGPFGPVEHRTKDGTLLQSAPNRCQILFDGREAVLVTVQDLTGYQRVAEELRRAQLFMEKAQEVVNIGTWLSDPALDGALTWSKETHRIFGVKEGEFDGRVETFFEFVHPDDRAAVAAASTAATRRRQPYRISHRIKLRDGAVRWVEEAATIVRDAKGKPTMMAGIVQDITERVAAQERVQNSQRMEAVGRLAGGIAHDFNNYLFGIMACATALRDSFRPKDRRRRDAEELMKAVEDASSLTRQLTAFSRRQVLEPRLIDPGAVLLDMKPILARLTGRAVRLELDLSHRGLRIMFDPSQLQQIILNLTVNAVDAMPKGGRLTLAVREAPAERRLELVVADTGVGMSAEVLPHIFEPFYTTKPRGKGTGLGLSTVYGIVKQSGGQILAQSEPGRGTTFRILLALDGRKRRAARP